MAPPINVQDWYGDRHTCQIASGALDCNDSVLTAGALRWPWSGQTAKYLSALCVGLQTEMRQCVCNGTVHHPKAD